MIKVRKANIGDVEAIAKLINKTWKISYKGILSENILDERTYQQNMPYIEKDIDSNNKVVLIAANDSSKIIGMVSGGICREKEEGYDSELYAIYVLPKYQGEGVGKLLFINFCIWLKERKNRSMMLWVLKANKDSREFYKRMGGKEVKEKQIDIGDKSFDAISYGWSELLVYNAKKDLIDLTDYDSTWPLKAKTEIKQIKNTIMKDLIVDVQHIGSTAIPNIKSKPIIDVIVGVKFLKDIEKNFINPLEAIGYLFRKDSFDKEHLFFVKGLPPFGKRRACHVHIVKHDMKVGGDWGKHIFFQEYLIENPKVAKSYEALKIKLAKQYSQDREGYTKNKQDFINKVLQKQIKSDGKS